MGQYSSYYLYQKYVSREGGDFVPVYPEVYSIDADGTMPKVIRLEEDTACGYNPLPEPMYRWYVKYTDANDYICYNYSKYYYEYYQVSYNDGLTWQDVTPIQKRRSSTVWEANSYDCGYGGDRYEWRKMVGEYICVDCGDELEPLNALYKLSNTNNGNVFQEACTSDGKIFSFITSALTKSDYNRLQIGNCCKEIGQSAFSGWTGLTGKLIIPDSVIEIGSSAFRSCSGFTGSLNIPDSVTTIGNYAFYNCRGFDGTLTLGTGLTSIGNYAFYNCSGFTGSLVIPDSVTEISNYAFYNCSGLNGYLTIHENVTRINNGAFQDCSNLKAIYCKATTPPLLDYDSRVFNYTNNCPIYVPSASVDAYKTANNWSTYSGRIQGY